MGSTDGAVDRRYHLCDPGSIPVLAVSCELSLLLRVLALLGGFFLGFSCVRHSTLKSTLRKIPVPSGHQASLLPHGFFKLPYLNKLVITL